MAADMEEMIERKDREMMIMGDAAKTERREIEDKGRNQLNQPPFLLEGTIFFFPPFPSCIFFSLLHFSLVFLGSISSSPSLGSITYCRGLQRLLGSH